MTEHGTRPEPSETSRKATQKASQKPTGESAEESGEELASLQVWLDESDFPADTDTVLALLVHRGSPSPILRRLAALPWSLTFADLEECQRTLRRRRPPPRSWPSPPHGAPH